MKIKHATKKIKTKCKSDITGKVTLGPTAQPWLEAAETARLKIEEHKKRIRLLQAAAQTFEEYAKEGQPWPQKAAT